MHPLVVTRECGWGRGTLNEHGSKVMRVRVHLSILSKKLLVNFCEQLLFPLACRLLRQFFCLYPLHIFRSMRAIFPTPAPVAPLFDIPWGHAALKSSAPGSHCALRGGAYHESPHILVEFPFATLAIIKTPFPAMLWLTCNRDGPLTLSILFFHQIEHLHGIEDEPYVIRPYMDEVFYIALRNDCAHLLTHTDRCICVAEQDVVFMGTQEVHPKCSKEQTDPWEYIWGDPENGGAAEGSELALNTHRLGLRLSLLASIRSLCWCWE